MRSELSVNGKWASDPLFLLPKPELEGISESVLTKKEQYLLDVVSAQAVDYGVEVVTVEVIGSSRSPVVRIYIDTDHGVTFSELSDAQEWIGKLFDDIDPFPGAYTLEVSSPGIDRPLRTPQHFAEYVGEKAKVRTSKPIDGSSNFTGTIVSCDDEALVLMIDGSERKVPFDEVKRANLIGKIEF